MRATYASLLLLSAVGLASCGSDSSVTPQTPRLRIVAARDTLNAIGQSVQLSASIETGGASRIVTDSLVWTVSSSALQVDFHGLVTSRATGTATITVSRGNLSDTATFVSRQVVALIQPTWTAETLFVGDSVAVLAKGRDSNNVTMPLPDLRIQSVSGSSVSQVTSTLLQAGQPGTTQVVIQSGTVSAQLSVYVESPFIAIAAGGVFSCALVDRGAVYCWGQAVAASGRPRVMPGLPPLVAIAAGVNHACGLTSQGDTYCWPYNGVPFQRMNVPQPLVSITAGYNTSCGLAADGSSYCWGSNSFGQLGVPGGDQLNPVRTSAPALQSVSTGSEQTCGLSAGTILCWGQLYGTSPQRVGLAGGYKSVVLGTGICAVQNNDVATCFSGPEGDATSYPTTAQVTVGDGWACSLLVDHTAKCWGINYYGELGIGSFSDSTITQPTPIQPSMQWRAISLGKGPTGLPGEHSCGLDMSGRAFCWGDDTWGEIGAPVSQARDSYSITTSPTRVTRSRLQ